MGKMNSVVKEIYRRSSKKCYIFKRVDSSIYAMNVATYYEGIWFCLGDL